MQTKPSQQPQQQSESKLHFLDYWRIIRIRKTVILAVFLLVVLTTTIITFLLPPTYASSVRIAIEKDNSDITPLMGLQDMLSTPQMESASFWSLMGSDGEHSSAQYLSPDWSWRMAAGVMVQPAGVSVGHLPPVAAGEHTEPATPVMVMFCSSDMQGPASGSP